MPRYIDADALISKLAYHRDGLDHNNVTAISVLNNVIEIIERRPTISSDEVRGVGKWIENHDRVKWWYECSCCHEKPLISRFGDMEILSTYCPNCGAKMEVSE